MAQYTHGLVTDEITTQERLPVSSTMPTQYPPYSVSRNSRNSRQSNRNSSGSPRRHTRRNNARPPTSNKREGGTWATVKDHLVAASGEFVGTTLFLFFAFGGTQVAAMSSSNKALDTNGVLFIALSFGFSLAVNAWAFYRISGGLFNPAVLLGMGVTGTLPWARIAFLFPAEILGGLAGSALNSCMFPGPIAVVTRLTNGTSITQGIFIEMFLTSLLIFVILMLAAEKTRATFIAPIGIGLALFVAELCGVYFTGGSLNPTRSFGPSVVAHDFPHYHYIYWIGPAMGALLAGAYYKFVKYFNYEEANPGQDADNEAEKKRSESA